MIVVSNLFQNNNTTIMQKFLLSLICAGLTGAILTGCETEAKKADAKPAPVAVSPAPAPAVAAKPAAATPAAVATGAIRIKAGSTTPVKDSAGNVFAAETGFEGGEAERHGGYLSASLGGR